MQIIVELGAGKINPNRIIEVTKSVTKADTIYIAVDRCYSAGADLETTELNIQEYYNEKLKSGKFITCNEDILKFVEGFSYKVNKIIANRILEHIPAKDMCYFLFILHSLIIPEGQLEFIVPDHEFYANDLISLSKTINEKGSDFRDVYNRLLNITTEFCNEPNDPHMSIWTKEFAKFYLELEGYWKLEECKNINIGNRNYLQIIAKPNSKGQ